MPRGPNTARLCLALCLVLAMGTVSFALERGLGLRPPTAAEEAALRGQLRPVTTIAPNALALARVQEERTRTGRVLPLALPTAVDNSTLAYFPPIRSQSSQSSCTAWASAYYYETYTQAKDEGYTVSGGDNAHICSPAFIYPLTNGGVDGGASLAYAMFRLGEIGCSSWANTPWSVSDFTTWPSETAWVQALQNRTATLHSFAANTPAGLTTLKQHLANGDLAVIGVHVWQTWYNSYPADAVGINKGVYYAKDGADSGGHALTVVGYDDSKSYVDHRDGLTHYGAFLIANSWGSGWGSTNSVGRGGFMWIAYSFFSSADLWYFDTNAYFSDDRPHYRPSLYAVAGVNHAQRGRVALQGGIDGLSVWSSPYAVYFDGGETLPVADDKRVAVDLSDGTGSLASDGLSTVSVTLTVNGSASGNGTLTSAIFFEDLDGDGVYAATASPDPTLTVAPGASGTAFATLNTTGLDYEIMDRQYPGALVWGGSCPASLVLRNLGPTSWTSAEACQLEAREGVNRWGLTAVPLGASVAPLASSSFSFDLTAPPLSTLAYPAPAGDGDPPGVAALPVDLLMARGGLPLAGAPLDDAIVLSRFPDIAPGTSGAWARGQIEECAGRVPLLVTGYGDGTYRPKTSVTRAQMAVFIARALDLPLAPYQGTFVDVAVGDFGAEQIDACVAADVVTGYSTGDYRPGNRVTRAQMAVFIARAACGGESAVPAYLGTPTFADVAPGAFGYNHIEYAAGRGIVTGYADDGTYRPLATVNRDQMAVFIYRAFVQSTASVVVLGGPAVTDQDPAVGTGTGWASLAAGPAAGPGYAYVVFDAARFGPRLYAAGPWRVRFELRAAADPDTPAGGAYTATLGFGGAEVAAMQAAARSSGLPYATIAWPLPFTLAPGDYLLVVSAQDSTGALREIARRFPFAIAP